MNRRAFLAAVAGSAIARTVETHGEDACIVAASQCPGQFIVQSFADNSFTICFKGVKRFPLTARATDDGTILDFDRFPDTGSHWRIPEQQTCVASRAQQQNKEA